MTSASCDRQVKLEATSGSVARRPRLERRARKLSKSPQKAREQGRTGTAGPPSPGANGEKASQVPEAHGNFVGCLALDEGLPRVGG